jgi:hypothetical protein
MPAIDDPKPERNGRSGLTTHDASRAWEGYTLCWSHGTRSARLIDMEAKEVHRWTLDRGVRWHWCDLLEDGHLLVVSSTNAYSPRQNADARLQELDRDGEVVWSDPAPCHHDARRLPNGHTLAVCNGHAHYPELSPRPQVYDYIQEITPENEVAWEWHFAAHAEALEAEEEKALPPGHGDWPHINTVEMLPDTPLGERDSRFRAGNILVSPRHMHCIFVIERETVWDYWNPDGVPFYRATRYAPDMVEGFLQ